LGKIEIALGKGWEKRRVSLVKAWEKFENF
jgi:hypothetical protein